MNKNTKKTLLIIMFIILYLIGIFFLPKIFIKPTTPDDPINNIHAFTIRFVITYIGLAILVFLVPIFLKLKKTRKIEDFKKNIETLQTTNEFEILYSKLFSNDITELERKRKKLKKAFVIQNIVAAILIIAYIFVFTKYSVIGEHKLSSDDMKAVAYGFFAVYGIVAFINTNKLSKYAKEYKNNIIQSFLKSLNTNLTFSPTVPKEVKMYEKFQHSEFDKGRFNYFESDDYIFDSQNNIHMCDLVIKNSHGKHTETLFRGMFSFTDLKIPFEKAIKIAVNNAILTDNSKQINLDDTEFEKYFDVYTEDRVLATRILTSDIMQMMINFYNRFKLSFEIVIKDDKLYLRFFTGPMFEPKIFAEIIDKKSLFVYYNVILFITELSNTINEELSNID